MRIIAGQWSSRRLATLPGNATRPTLDKVRGAVFSSLGGFFDGGIFLDLYAGSGACGLEALSRGMQQAVFCDSSGAAAKIIRQNVHSLGAESQSRILIKKDMTALNLLHEEGMLFDIIYLDPPYKKEHNKEVLQYLSENEMVKRHGYAVVESLKEDVFPQRIGRFTKYKEAEYGVTRITYYLFEEEIL